MTPQQAPFARISRWASNLVLDALSLIVLAILVRAVILVTIETYQAYVQYEPGALKEIGLSVLTVFVFVEIFSLFRDYREHSKLSVPHVLSLSITIVVREIWIMLFEGTATWQELFGVSAVLLVVGALWLAVHRTPWVDRAPRGGPD
jgi:uncharacterized membrane protein (DUF373 family)